MQFHCFGWVNAVTGACTPIWGYQPPVYSVLLGVVQTADPESRYYVVLIQTVIFAIAATYAFWAAYSWHKSLTALLISGALIAPSPATIASNGNSRALGSGLAPSASSGMRHLHGVSKSAEGMLPLLQV